MHMVWSRRIFLPSAFLALGVQMWSPFSGFVLCLGWDGHVEIESTVNAACGNLPNFPIGKNSPLFHPLVDDASPDHCGGCADVPILFEEARIPRNRNLGGFPGAFAISSPHSLDATMKPPALSLSSRSSVTVLSSSSFFPPVLRI
jgi:hypothetical protein